MPHQGFFPRWPHDAVVAASVDSTHPQLMRGVTLCLIGVLGVIETVASPTLAQPMLRVRAETRVELNVTDSNDSLRITGSLHDDVGTPLRHTYIGIRVVEKDNRAHLKRQLRTDSDGNFQFETELRPAITRITAAFPGTSFYERSEAEQEIDLIRIPIRLSLQLDNQGQLDLDQTFHVVHIVASVRTQRALPGDSAIPSESDGSATSHSLSGLPITLRDELGRKLGSSFTDDAGRTSMRIRSDELGEPGAGRLSGQFAGSAAYAPAQIETPILRHRKTMLTLRRSASVNPRERVTLSGKLYDSQGPLTNRAVGIFFENEHARTILTSRDGTFRCAFERSDKFPFDGTVVARFESDSLGWDSAESNPVAIRGQDAWNQPWPWMVLSAVICLLLLLTVGRRPGSNRSPERARGDLAPGIAERPRGSLRSTIFRVSGRVLDHHTGRPVANAWVWIDSHGASQNVPLDQVHASFASADVRRGEPRIRAGAPGYEHVERVIKIPHSGEWSDFEVRLQSTRALALGAFQRVANKILPRSRDWFVTTNQEVSARRPHDASLARLAQQTDSAYYGPEAPDLAEVTELNSKAQKIVAEESERDKLFKPSR